MKKLEETKGLLTTIEAAKMLGVSAHTVRAWAKKGKLPSLRFSSKGYTYFNRTEIERLVK